MRVRFSVIRAGVALASVMLAATLLTGCKNEQDTGQKPTPPPVVVSKPAERVELMPDTSEEFLRRHYIDANGFEVETRIEYRNGDKAVLKYRADQTQESYKRTAKNGTVLIEQNFAADGKSVVGGRELRPDGTLKWQTTQDSSGAVTTEVYWYDGKSVFAQTTQNPPGGAWSATYFRKDSKLWMKTSGPKTGQVTRQEVYDGGRLAVIMERNGQDVVATALRADGTAEFKQYITETASNYGGYVYSNIRYVEEFAADGKTVVRKLVMDSNGYGVTAVERTNPDGTTTVRTLRYDRTVIGEETRDANGNVISQKTIDPSEKISEKVDYRAIRSTTPDNPVQRWEYEEKYPQWRS